MHPYSFGCYTAACHIVLNVWKYFLPRSPWHYVGFCISFHKIHTALLWQRFDDMGNSYPTIASSANVMQLLTILATAKTKKILNSLRWFVSIDWTPLFACNLLCRSTLIVCKFFCYVNYKAVFLYYFFTKIVQIPALIAHTISCTRYVQRYWDTPLPADVLLSPDERSRCCLPSKVAFDV